MKARELSKGLRVRMKGDRLNTASAIADAKAHGTPGIRWHVVRHPFSATIDSERLTILPEGAPLPSGAVRVYSTRRQGRRRRRTYR